MADVSCVEASAAHFTSALAGLDLVPNVGRPYIDPGGELLHHAFSWNSDGESLFRPAPILFELVRPFPVSCDIIESGSTS